VKQYKKGLFFSYDFVGENSWNGYERNCLFANVGYVPPSGPAQPDARETRQFMDVARPTGSDCLKDSRGVAMADFNGDGQLDLVINNNNQTPTLYLNKVKRSGNSVVIKLEGLVNGSGSLHTSLDAVGAQVRLSIPGKTMMRQVEAGSGFAAEGMLPVHFGVGDATRIDSVEITWPSGLVQKFDNTQTKDWLNSDVDIKEGVPAAIKLRPYSRLPTAGPRKNASSEQRRR